MLKKFNNSKPHSSENALLTADGNTFNHNTQIVPHSIFSVLAEGSHKFDICSGNYKKQIAN